MYEYINLKRDTEAIEGELINKAPDGTIVQRLVGRILDVISSATDSALGLVLTAYAKELMKSAGLPLG